jgi:hypothetical protein
MNSSARFASGSDISWAALRASLASARQRSASSFVVGMRYRTRLACHKNVTGEHRVPTNLVRYQTGARKGAWSPAEEALTLKIG